MHKQNVNVNGNVFQMMTVRLATVLVLGCLIAADSVDDLIDQLEECEERCYEAHYTCVQPCTPPDLYVYMAECNGVDCEGLIDHKCLEACRQQYTL